MTSLITALVFLDGLGLKLISGDRGIVGLKLVFVFIGGLVAGLLIDILFVFLCRNDLLGTWNQFS